MKKLLTPVVWVLNVLAFILAIPGYFISFIGLEIYDWADSLRMYINEH